MGETIVPTIREEATKASFSSEGIVCEGRQRNGRRQVRRENRRRRRQRRRQEAEALEPEEGARPGQGAAREAEEQVQEERHRLRLQEPALGRVLHPLQRRTA